MNTDPNQTTAQVDQWVSRIGTGKEAIIPLLHAVQDEYRYLPEPALRHICEVTEITPSDIAGVSTFYTRFRHEPIGEHLIHVCTGTACHVKGADLILEAFAREKGLTFRILHDPTGKIQETYQTTGVPESFVVDRNGVIFKKVAGPTEWDAPAHIQLIQRLLGG